MIYFELAASRLTVPLIRLSAETSARTVRFNAAGDTVIVKFDSAVIASGNAELEPLDGLDGMDAAACRARIAAGGWDQQTKPDAEGWRLIYRRLAGGGLR